MWDRDTPTKPDWSTIQNSDWIMRRHLGDLRRRRHDQNPMLLTIIFLCGCAQVDFLASSHASWIFTFNKDSLKESWPAPHNLKYYQLCIRPLLPECMHEMKGYCNFLSGRLASHIGWSFECDNRDETMTITYRTFCRPRLSDKFYVIAILLLGLIVASQTNLHPHHL